MIEKRIIHTDAVREAVRALVRDANLVLPPPAAAALELARRGETGELARCAMDIICENAAIAERERLPLCQDCGAAIVFIELGQGVSLAGPFLLEAVNAGVADATAAHHLRASIVSDPLRRANTGTNAPAFAHVDPVPGDSFRITVLLKGGGSENMTALRLFKPTDEPATIVTWIAEAVRAAGPNPCPPLFLGVGIGGTADVAALNAKRAVLRGDAPHPDPFYVDLENAVRDACNATGIGPLGFGGETTVARAYIVAAPAHIATLPVAVNMNCHSLRYRSMSL
ncbi:MAG TPA: fumarate hydratase [Spirochaetota bacterium]|nr:fumarate hydratase [Spirochaetota bacterium]HNT10121.1 fumarate hydratase [Spirochaetota bacterium]